MAARVPQPPSLPPSPAALSAEELVARLQERGAAIQTLKAQFSIEATGKDIKGTQRMEAAMIYQRPNLVRLRTFARIGLPIFDLILINDRYQIKIPMQGKFLTGRVADLDRQEGLGPSILLGVQATLGNLNGTTVLPTDHLRLREAEGLYALEVIPSEEGVAVARRLWFDQGTLELVPRPRTRRDRRLPLFALTWFEPRTPTAEQNWCSPFVRSFPTRRSRLRTGAFRKTNLWPVSPGSHLTPAWFPL